MVKENYMKKLFNYKKVYFVGIGGISMSSLALILKSWGKEVLGYDKNFSKETKNLEENEVEVSYSTSDPNLDGVDLLVYTAAVNLTHPIIAEAASRSVEIISRAELLGEIAKGYPVSIGVAGTHGKSTTSGMIAKIYDFIPGKNPTFAVGAHLPFASGCHKIGDGDTFIFEADEYKDSFLKFYPTTAVVLNVFRDHPDYFASLEQLIESFSKYISHSKKAIINLDSPGAVESAKSFGGEVFYFSTQNKADFYAADITCAGGYETFDLFYPGGDLKITLSVPGHHNVQNAVAAFAACFVNGLEPSDISSGLMSFTGVSRRFETIGNINGAVVISDYAHHPDEVTACLTTAKKIAPGRVITVFQPHTFTRLKALFGDFVTSFSLSDLLAVTEVFSAREGYSCGVDGKTLAEKAGGVYCGDFNSAAEFIKSNARPGDFVVLMGAGDIYKVFDLLA